MKNRLMLLTLLLMSLLMLAGSCVTQKRCLAKFPPQTSDSIVRTIHYKEVLHDTALKVIADSSMIKALLQCDSAGNVVLKQLLGYQSGKNIKPPDLSISGNVLTIRAKVDSFKIYAFLKDKYYSDSTGSVLRITTPVRINYLTGWQWVQVYAGRLFLLLSLGFGAYKIIKWKFNIPLK